jgi:putative acetyltransferase
MEKWMTIRPATEADLEAITWLFAETIRAVNARDYNEEQIRVWTAAAENEEKWRQRIRTQHFLLAEMAQRIAGFASITNQGYLDMMYVDKDCQAQGIGRRLLRAIEDIAGSLGIRRIESDVSITARPFFEKHGYRVDKEQQVMVREVILNNYKMSKEF